QIFVIIQVCPPSRICDQWSEVIPTCSAFSEQALKRCSCSVAIGRQLPKSSNQCFRRKHVRWNRLDVPDVFRRIQRRKGLKGFFDSNKLPVTGSWNYLCVLPHPCITCFLVLRNDVNGQQALNERLIFVGLGGIF